MPKRNNNASRALLLACALSLLVGPSLASGQGLAQPGVPSKSTATFYGLTQTEVSTKFGKPDEVKTKQNGGEEWAYGRSVIFFSNGKVMAWSDAGELAQREKLATLKSDKTKPDDSLSDQWENPWTPPKRGAQNAPGLEDFIPE